MEHGGFELWVEWSKSCPEEFDHEKCVLKWQTFRPDGGLTRASIFAWAKERGWKPTKKYRYAKYESSNEVLAIFPAIASGSMAESKKDVIRKFGDVDELGRDGARRPGTRITSRSVQGHEERGPDFDEACSEPEKRDKKERPTFSNFIEELIEDDEGKSKTVIRPTDYEFMDLLLGMLVPHRFERVQDKLFFEGADYRPVYLKKTTQLFSIVQKYAVVDWNKRGDMIKQGEYFEHVRMEARVRCHRIPAALSKNPGAAYMHRPIPESTGKLKEFIDRFSPATDVDRDLILSYILTLSWGGEPGSRPLFLATGLPDDRGRGRGIGKSMLFQIIADDLFGGSMEAGHDEKMADFKTRLLSPEGVGKRACRIDNLKTLRLSWAELEGMITTAWISGRELFAGEGRRPNTMTWSVTLNGGSLSTDLAQRAITIVLRRPEYTADWEGETRRMAREYRWEIIAESLALLASHEGKQIETRTRWGPWERSVLARSTNDLAACQRSIIGRQEGYDADQDESFLVRDYFAARIDEFHGNHETTYAKIESGTCAQWLSAAIGENHATCKATTKLKGMGIPELSYDRGSHFRGFVWRGGKVESVDGPPRQTIKSNRNNFSARSGPFDLSTD